MFSLFYIHYNVKLTFTSWWYDDAEISIGSLSTRSSMCLWSFNIRLSWQSLVTFWFGSPVKLLTCHQTLWFSPLSETCVYNCAFAIILYVMCSESISSKTWTVFALSPYKLYNMSHQGLLIKKKKGTADHQWGRRHYFKTLNWCATRPHKHVNTHMHTGVKSMCIIDLVWHHYVCMAVC